MLSSHIEPRWAKACSGFLDALHESEGAQPHVKDCEVRSQLRVRSQMEQAETLATTVWSLSDTPEKLAQLNTHLKGSDDMLKRSIPVLNDLLAMLDPSKYTLAWLYILDTMGGESPPPQGAEGFCVHANTLITASDPDQLRIAPEKFSSVCRKFKEICIAAGHPARAAMPLKTAIRKVQPDTQYLSPQHGDFLQVCLLAKMYNAAVDILKDDVYEANPTLTGLVPRDFLLYCYYGGMIYCGKKRWSKALDMFQHAITAPAMALNAITVASYKKHLVVSLICRGEPAGLPKYTSAVVHRHVKACASEYGELAAAYATRNQQDLRACIAKHEEKFKEDKNLGLVKQCVDSLYMRNIQRLTQTYLTLSLGDIARLVELPGAAEAEAHVLRMIETDGIHASINQKDGMVSFLEEPEQYNSVSIMERLDAEVQNMVLLAKKVAMVDEQVSMNSAYIGKMMLKERHGRGFTDHDDFEVA
mmetsp:Transcript_14250/g.30526  ORF Transcript_14250/g.30526 Transcript_14250/m.30526 type:complete len:473 (-) Transcript_14250:192-1610(-)